MSAMCRSLRRCAGIRRSTHHPRRPSGVHLREGGRNTMTMTTRASDVLIVPMTVNTAEVRLSVGDSVVHIGQVGAANGQWFWRHRDGEQSSPISGNRMEAAE